MQSIISCGRLVTRLVCNSLHSYSSSAVQNVSANKVDTKSSEHSCSSRRIYEPRLLSVMSGFAKNLNSRQILPGRYGDDACFVACHKIADVIGVADGVGGWREYGIDPGIFSYSLIKSCEKLVSTDHFNPTNPTELIRKSFTELSEMKQQILGSSTACVLILNKINHTLYTANIGDSGFLVVRKGEIVHRSEEQTHYFNTPFQLSLPPPGSSSHVLCDSPESAETSEFPVENGDVILVGTDGVFDNMPDALLLPQLSSLWRSTDKNLLQQSANSIALQARTLGFDSKYLSPFAKTARLNGISAIGGKPDDVTVLLATVIL